MLRSKSSTDRLEVRRVRAEEECGPYHAQGHEHQPTHVPSPLFVVPPVGHYMLGWDGKRSTASWAEQSHPCDSVNLFTSALGAPREPAPGRSGALGPARCDRSADGSASGRTVRSRRPDERNAHARVPIRRPRAGRQGTAAPTTSRPVARPPRCSSRRRRRPGGGRGRAREQPSPAPTPPALPCSTRPTIAPCARCSSRSTRS